jgi:hypothetical protein
VLDLPASAFRCGGVESWQRCLWLLWFYPKSYPMKRKAGRPKLPKGEAKVETLRLRVTPEELKTYQRAAKASEQTLSEWDSWCGKERWGTTK